MENKEDVKPTRKPRAKKEEGKPPKTPKKGKKKEKVDGRKKVNKWMKHVMEYRKKHPEVAYRDVLKQAKETYKKD